MLRRRLRPRPPHGVDLQLVHAAAAATALSAVDAIPDAIPDTIPDTIHATAIRTTTLLAPDAAHPTRAALNASARAAGMGEVASTTTSVS